ncbi:hypothetical protein [Leptolyngbya sp. Cla-17]|uniref:hypothetical protein n=1 Tax=Leptolyngbya sp. Cla-17 TaxID=2803751 RepID=UPI0018D63C2B|nr:hypothetical protein [Leptolyngbya sp. Cla-17]
MISTELSTQLSQLFGEKVETLAPGSWQVDTPEFRLLVLLSDDQSWLRILIAIAPAQEAQPFIEQLMEDNFDVTQETRYALQQDVLWGVYQHSCAGLNSEDFVSAVQRLLHLRQRGFSDCFSRLIEARVRQIVYAAKQQGQSLEATLQTLDRFYEEGLLGDMKASAEARGETLSAWRYPKYRTKVVGIAQSRTHWTRMD